MKISNNCLSLIKQFEGCRLESYLCPSKVWTIGYGHTSGVKKGQKITQEQAELFLREDIIKFENEVNKYQAIYQFKQHEFDALVSFTYNCGAGNLRLLLNNGKRTTAEISEKIPAYNKSNNKVLTGLVRRRNSEKKMFDGVVK